MGQALRFRLPIKNGRDVQRVLNAVGTVESFTRQVSTGVAFRRKLAKRSDAQPAAFRDATKLLAKVLPPLEFVPVFVEGGSPTPESLMVEDGFARSRFFVRQWRTTCYPRWP